MGGQVPMFPFPVYGSILTPASANRRPNCFRRSLWRWTARTGVVGRLFQRCSYAELSFGTTSGMMCMLNKDVCINQCCLGLLSRPIPTICVQYVCIDVNAKGFCLNSFSCISTLSCGWGGWWIYIYIYLEVTIKSYWWMDVDMDGVWWWWWVDVVEFDVHDEWMMLVGGCWWGMVMIFRSMLTGSKGIHCLLARWILTSKNLLFSQGWIGKENFPHSWNCNAVQGVQQNFGGTNKSFSQPFSILPRHFPVMPRSW